MHQRMYCLADGETPQCDVSTIHYILLRWGGTSDGDALERDAVHLGGVDGELAGVHLRRANAVNLLRSDEHVKVDERFQVDLEGILYRLVLVSVDMGQRARYDVDAFELHRPFQESHAVGGDQQGDIAAGGFQTAYRVEAFQDEAFRFGGVGKGMVAVFVKVAQQILEAEYGGIIVAARLFLHEPEPFFEDGCGLEKLAVKLAPVEGRASLAAGFVDAVQQVAVGIEMDLPRGLQLQEARCEVLAPHVQDAAVEGVVSIFAFTERPVVGGGGEVVFQAERVGVADAEGQAAAFAVCVEGDDSLEAVAQPSVVCFSVDHGDARGLSALGLAKRFRFQHDSRGKETFLEAVFQFQQLVFSSIVCCHDFSFN